MPRDPLAEPPDPFAVPRDPFAVFRDPLAGPRVAGRLPLCPEAAAATGAAWADAVGAA
jgi:hypothetical protein